MLTIQLGEGAWYVCPDHYDEALLEALATAKEQGLHRPITLNWAPGNAACGGCIPDEPITLGDFDPLVLLVMFRAILAMRAFSPTELRSMSLREAVIEVGSITPTTQLVQDLLCIYDLSLAEAQQLVEACQGIADADAKLSLLVEPDRRVVRVDHQHLQLVP